MFGIAAGAVGASALAGEAAASARPPAGFVLVDAFPGRPGSDDSAAIRWALTEASRIGAAVLFSGREYRISETIDLPTGIQLLGTGAVLGAERRGPTGTILRRTSDVVMLRAKGRSFLRGGPMRHSIMIRGMLLHGGDQPSDLVQLISAARITVQDCFFVASKGRNLLLWETFDSRVVNTDFEWGGAPGDEIPMIELRSGGGLEYTNQVHFVGCRCESYPGTAIALTGGNTNEIFFTNCKLESLLPMANQPALALGGANVVRFGGVQVTSRGSRGATMRSLVEIRDSSFVTGDLYLEHLDGDGDAARLSSYLDLGGSQAVDLKLFVYDGSRRLSPDAYVSFDRTSSKACTVRGILRRGRDVMAQNWTS
ncbi:hypothetical protein EXY23_09615 [Roseicella aquatilis]|uniref:Pectate lyase superfamily protein domain-containing protein n=1 Tax=Roseicella aquatilis TaxID=2527868 RepID=A0A4R4DQX3_9PROT|nr:hypothetical protein EXY23_09615 [Roseicella aquatilis]